MLVSESAVMCCFIRDDRMDKYFFSFETFYNPPFNLNWVCFHKIVHTKLKLTSALSNVVGFWILEYMCLSFVVNLDSGSIEDKL